MKKHFYYCYCSLLVLFLCQIQAHAQLTVIPGNTISLTPQQFVETYLVGSGVTISNATFNGSSNPINIINTAGGSSVENQQIGNFTTAGGTTGEITFTGGVIMSSGLVTSASIPGTNASTATLGPGGDPDLAKIANVATNKVFNQAILEFDFVAQTDVIKFRYEFASEEFDDFCASSYNDSFGFFLSGPGIAGGMGYVNDAVNIAILPNSTQPVTIHNVCNNKPEYSWWNRPEKDLAYNRFTFVFTASYAITCLQTYHIKLAICDAGDDVYDSGVFLEQNSFTSNDMAMNTSFSNPLGGNNAIVNCSDAIVVFHIPTVLPSDYLINLAIDPASTAAQADFLPNPLPATVTITAGQTQSTPLVISPIHISQPGGTESLIIDGTHTVCAISNTISSTITFRENQPITASITPPPSGLICDGNQVILSVNISGGYPAYSFLWSGGATGNPATITASAASPVVMVQISDICSNTASPTISLPVTALPAPAGIITGATNVCIPSSNVPYHIDPVVGATEYSWRTPVGVPLPPIPSSNDVLLNFGPGSTTGTVEVTGVNVCGEGARSILPVTVSQRPIPALIPPPGLCLGAAATYTTDVGMSGYTWIYPAADATLAGGGTSSDNWLSLIWNTPGMKTITVNYTNAGNCTAILPTTLSFQVSSYIIPFISGPAGVCIGSPPVIYTADAGMSNYQWTVSAGNSIVTSGNQCSVTWNTSGSQWIKVTFVNPSSGCTSSPADPGLAVTVYPLPVPAVNGVSSGCQSIQLGAFTTETGKTGYLWNPDGGTLVQGSGPNVAFITWNSAGTKQISVTYVDSHGCQGTSPLHQVVVIPTPLTTFSSTTPISCPSSNAFPLTPYGSPAGGTFSGQGVIFASGIYYFNPALANIGPNPLTYTYTNPQGCQSSATGSLTVSPFPDVTINGPVPGIACQGQSSAFNVPSDPNSSFTWSVLPSGAGNLITPQGQASATINWLSPGTNILLSVTGLTNHGCIAVNQISVEVHQQPVVNLEQCFDPVTVPAAKPFVLHGGTPIGASGIFSGEGVTFSAGQYRFDPASVAGPFPKSVSITYKYTNMFGCQASAIKPIQVINSPSFQCDNPMMPLIDIRTSPVKTYTTYWRGNRCWMLQNLDYGLESSMMLTQTDNCIPQKFCAASDPGCSSYGGFYQWDELMQYSNQEGTQGLCPPAWHIPTLNEWQLLIDDPAYTGDGLAGGYLKDIPFSSSLEGLLYMNNTWSFLQGSSLNATMFWTSTPNNSNTAWSRGLNNYNPSVSLYSSSRLNAFPVRCIKD